MTRQVLDFPRDNLRFQYFVRESVEHGAKLEIQTYEWLVGEYTKRGDTILDPMAGIGTVHYAIISGRHTMGIELHDRFMEIQQLNITKLQGIARERRLTPGLTQTFLGDARRFLPITNQQVDVIIFSPPYGSVFKKPAVRHEMFKEKSIYKGYGDEFANIGNIPVYPIYLQSMQEIYKLCNQSLAIGQLMILITKDYVKQRERVSVSVDTIRICMEVGFQLEDWHFRIVNPSIWQIMNRERVSAEVALGTRKSGLDINHEDILVLRKIANV